MRKFKLPLRVPHLFIGLKKENAKKRLVIFLVVTYVVFLVYALHVGALMDMERMDLYHALVYGFSDIFVNPFAIFPISVSTAAWIFIISVLLIVGGFFIYFDEELRSHYLSGSEHGTAKWLEELNTYNRRFTDPIGETGHDGPNNIILSQDIFLAMDNQRTRRNLNVFVIGGSGSGKSYNFVGPNLMQANSSYVVTDPSGGLFKEYGTFFEHMGYHVKCFNLNRMKEGNHYNPFRYIHGAKDVEILVTTLISNTTPPEKSGGDPFWEKSETALLVALIAFLHFYCEKSKQNFSNVMTLLRQADIDENDASLKSELDRKFEEVEAKDPESFAVKQYKTFKMGAGKTLKSILISCAVRLQAFDLVDVSELTDTDDIDLDSVGDEKTALFVIIPTGEKTFNFLASMMYSQLFQRLYGYCEGNAKYSSVIMDSDRQVVRTFRADGPGEKGDQAVRAKAEEFLQRAQNAKIVYNKDFKWFELRTDRDELVTWRGAEELAKEALAKIRGGKVISNSEQSNHGERLPIHTRLILDEFANIGKIPEFPEKVATIRKYEISVAIILQSLSQMKKMYKDEWEELSGNCDSTIYLGGGADQMTTEWISKLLGKETRKISGTTFGKGGGSMSINKQGVELFAPDQLRTMDENDCVVLVKSQLAYKGRKYMSDEHPNRSLVKQLVKDTGEYVYNEEKSAWLSQAVSGGGTEESHEDKFGKKKRISKEEAELAKKIDENSRERKNEFLNNERKNTGERIIGENQDARNGNTDFSERMGIADDDTIDESIIFLTESTDRIWDTRNIMFVEQEADG